MPDNQKLTVLGAGWLGLPLAKSLQMQGYQVTVTRSSAVGCRQTAAQGLSCQPCMLGEPISNEQAESIFKTDMLIVTFPPGFRQPSQGKDYLKKWRQVIELANQYSVKNIMMTSSTAVYPEIDAVMTEDDACAYNEKSEILLAAESLLKTEFNGDYLVLRLAGLFGPDRHPARFVNKLKQLNQNAPANMLHLDDAVGAINFLIQNKIVNQTLNISSPEFISKADFYQAAAFDKNESITLPIITKGPKNKQISSQKLIDLGYSFCFKNAAQAFNQVY